MFKSKCHPPAVRGLSPLRLRSHILFSCMGPILFCILCTVISANSKAMAEDLLIHHKLSARDRPAVCRHSPPQHRHGHHTSGSDSNR